jgi:hypothetical protein
MRGTAWLILERLLAKLIEIAAADPELGGHLGHWGPAEEGEDGGDTLGTLSGYDGLADAHDGFFPRCGSQKGIP